VLGPDGKPFAGAKVETKLRPAGTIASVYTAETGATPAANPATTDVRGKVVQWADRGAYESLITGSGIESFAEPWDSWPGAEAPWPGWPEALAAPPGSPVDGQLFDFVADAANGVVWTLRYRAASASAYKWEFVGGPPLRSEIETSQSTPSGTYVDLATVGPTLTVPRAGDYDVTVGCSSGNSAGQWTSMSYQVGAVAAVDIDACGTAGPAVSTGFRERRKTALAAATLITAKYRVGGSGTATFEGRMLEMKPVRLS
jgi:hypothetical protein